MVQPMVRRTFGSLMFNRLKRKNTMKNLWKVMVAALVIIGATACSENVENIEKAEGFSFYAEVVNGTRATIADEDGDKTWETKWELGDKLYVNDTYEFVCTDVEKGKFTCYDDAVATLAGQTVTVTTDGKHHSKQGQKALYTTATVENFGAGKVALQSLTSFFRFTVNGPVDVALTLTSDSFRNENGTTAKTFELMDVAGEAFVAFWPTGEEVTLSVSINGESKSVTRQLKPGMVYNLGTLITPGVASDWAIIGDFNADGVWVEKRMNSTWDANVYVVRGVVIPKDYFSILIKKWNDSNWSVKYGGGIVYFNPGNYMTVYSGGSDISITKAGTYDFYFDNGNNKRLYVVAAGADYKAVSEQKVEGEEPKQEEPEVTEKVVYLKPNSNWTQANARFAAYFWNDGGSVWVSMKAVGDGSGIYEVHLPEGYNYGCNVIFARMNPSTTANNWNNKWNQTSDLKTPTDGKNLYTIASGAWDKGGGSWSVKQ